jgi:serine/threonine protein kinase/WD40 repeat protein/Flp pilus assembly protein TadD
MSPVSLGSDNQRNPVEVLAEEFVERQRQGEHPSLEEYIQRFPDLAGEIRDLFPALVMVERLKPGGDEIPCCGEGQPAGRAQHLGEPTGRLGDYRILREVGRGGMGVVYEAVQESLGRHVALKVLPGDGRLSPAQIERFRLEARSAARLHHGNIVPVHGVGEYQGVHYYAVQFIQGHGLDAILDDLRRLRGLAAGSEEPCRDDGSATVRAGRTGSLALACSLLAGASEKAEALAGRTDALAPTLRAIRSDDPSPARSTADTVLPPCPELATANRGAASMMADISTLSLATESQFYRSVARIGIQVADALGYAHQQGVLHRDIKPSNLLLDVTGHVWVTDFGLAKVEGSDGPTRTGDIVGTVRYMAPERFDGWSDRRSDVYSLGATLYELLTLHPMFPGLAHAELIEKVLHDAPDWPRRLDPKIPRDLETIVWKAIAKEPGDRYPSPRALCDDLQRFLEDRPILARRSTSVEQIWRWCRRNLLLAAALATAAAAIVMLAIVSTAMAWKFRVQRDYVRQAETRTRENLFQALAAQARATRFSRQKGQRFDSLAALGQAAAIARELELPPESFDRLRVEAIACLALPDLKPAGRVIARPPGIYLANFDPTMTPYALRFKDGTIQVRRVADDHEVARFEARGDREVFFLNFSPDGRYLLTTHFPGYGLTAWDVERHTVQVNEAGLVHAAQFSPDSRRLALVKQDRARGVSELLIDDLATGQPSRRWRLSGPGNLAFRPDGSQIAVMDNASKPPACRIRETETGRPIRTISLPMQGGWVAWSPDGTTLAIATSDNKIHLWDAATGVRKAAFDSHTHGGLRTAFHPAGTLLASHGWENRVWLWDPVLGQPWLSLSSDPFPEFSQDGDLVIALEDTLTPYQVDPAREYRSLAHPASRPIQYGAPFIRHDGRLLAVGTSLGVALWDLARGVELAFLPIGYASWSKLEPSGDLLTSGPIGVWRWPIHLDLDRGEFRIGPPCQLPLPAKTFGIDQDRSGRIVALAAESVAHVLTPEQASDIGPLDDCRSVAVSPDGAWLATGSHGKASAQVWRLSDATRVSDLAIEGLIAVVFSPDGKWLITSPPPCRLWAVGTWREARRISGSRGLGFSPDGRLVLVVDVSRALGLIATETGRTLARLESPDLHNVVAAGFSPDGSRLVVTTNDGPAVHVWDLRAIRRRLVGLGLDWDAPSFSDDDPADPTSPPLPPLQLDLGPLAGDAEHFTEPPESLIQRYTARLETDPNDAESYHHRAHALIQLQRLQEGIEDWTQAIRLRPADPHLRVSRAKVHASLGRYEPAITDLEAALALKPDQPLVRDLLAFCCNNRAWELATGPESQRDLGRALVLSRRAADLYPRQAMFLNTLGVVHYRAGRYAEAIAILEQSLAAGRGQSAGFYLFFLAIAHHRLGHRDQARACFDQAVCWLRDSRNLTEQSAQELTAFRGEAEAVLAGPGGELPANVFAELQ